MNNEQLLAEIREANLTYLMLAQTMIRQDKAEAVFRLGLNEESCELLGSLSSAQVLKLASRNTLLASFRADDEMVWSLLTNHSSNKIGNADYSSPNFFVAQAAEHMNAKVSPYLAFLTQMHEKISAMEPPVVNNIQGWDRIPEGQNIYLDADGNPMAESDFDAETKQLMADYKLIQYDITTGKNYLKDTSFMDLP